MVEVVISQKQARALAQLIYRDIHKYCEDHREEYEAFLREDQKGAGQNAILIMPYQQIDKEHYPQLYKNKRQRVVLSAIGTGREQGAHLRDLHRATGFGERSVRKVIEDIRRAGVVVCNSLDGYFFPETLDELRLYVRQEERRGRSTFYTLGSARRLLQELEEVETGDEEA